MILFWLADISSFLASSIKPFAIRGHVLVEHQPLLITMMSSSVHTVVFFVFLIASPILAAPEIKVFRKCMWQDCIFFSHSVSNWNGRHTVLTVGWLLINAYFFIGSLSWIVLDYDDVKCLQGTRECSIMFYCIWQFMHFYYGFLAQCAVQLLLFWCLYISANGFNSLDIFSGFWKSIHP